MGKSHRINVKSRNYRGVSAVPLPQGEGKPEEHGLFDLRPMRFAALGDATAMQILTELVNLPDDQHSPEVEAFITKKWDLALGGSDSGGRLPDRMRAPEVIRLRGLYRLFWEPLVSADVRGLVVKENPQLNKSDGEGGYFQDAEEIKAAIAAKDPKELKAAVAEAQKKRGTRLGSLKASIFMQLLGPDLRAFQSPISEMHDKAQQAYLDSKKSLYPRGDYRDGALRINWKTGALTIVARGPIDKLTHAVFQYRNRLRECPMCKRLFVAFGSNESFCPFGCKLERERERKRKDAKRRRAALRVDGLTSRGNKPKRKIAH
jgi:hypothetical protein